MIETICGVDVSKSWLDGWTVAGGHRRFVNNPAGITELGEWAVAHNIALVVMEATGGIEQDAFRTLWQQGLPCALTNPRQVRKFAEAMGKLEKTDRIDAEVIARHADALRVNPTNPKSEKQQHLDALSTRLRQVTSDLTGQKKRLHTTHDRVARESLGELIALLNKQAKDLSRRVAELVNDDPLWTALDQTFRSVKGVADRTVCVLLAELPEIGTLSNKAVAKLVGLSPIANDSGKRQGRRQTRGGRVAVRSILFLVADIVRKYDQFLTEFRQRLIDQGKPKMVIRIALARKLLVKLNAMARETRQSLAANA